MSRGCGAARKNKHYGKDLDVRMISHESEEGEDVVWFKNQLKDRRHDGAE